MSKVAGGKWQVVSGQWSVVSGQWSVVSGQWWWHSPVDSQVANSAHSQAEADQHDRDLDLALGAHGGRLAHLPAEPH